jgi:hypothetical protein
LYGGSESSRATRQVDVRVGRYRAVRRRAFPLAQPGIRVDSELDRAGVVLEPGHRDRRGRPRRVDSGCTFGGSCPAGVSGYPGAEIGRDPSTTSRSPSGFKEARSRQTAPPGSAAPPGPTRSATGGSRGKGESRRVAASWQTQIQAVSIKPAVRRSQRCRPSLAVLRRSRLRVAERRRERPNPRVQRSPPHGKLSGGQRCRNGGAVDADVRQFGR